MPFFDVEPRTVPRETSQLMPLWCSFCGVADRGPRGRLIAGHYVWICRDCVELCNELLQLRPTEDQERKANEDISLPFRKRLPPEELIESATEEFQGEGLARNELEEVADAAYRRAVEEFVHGEEPPLQVYARRRVHEEIRRALAEASPGEGG